MSGPNPGPSKFNFESTSRKLLSPSLGDGLRCATDLRERIEIVHTSEYVNFLRFLFPTFRELLLNRLHSDSATESIENRFRHVILEILNRLPNNELLRPYTPELLRIATETLARDNEENALTCLRIIFDLHKNFRPALEGEVQAFLDLVRRVYRMLPTSVKKAFAASVDAQSATVEKSSITVPAVGVQSLAGPHRIGRPEAQQFCASTVNLGYSRVVLPTYRPTTPLKGLDSFKVLTECPLIVMLLFQLYPRYIQDNIPQLTPLMMGGLALRVSSLAHRLQRERYREFIACQVKTLSFLTYLLRGFSDLMKPYQDAISKSVIALMIACPGDAVATRKELLVATRHILATDFRRGFFGYVDILLDEKVLVGIGRPSQESLRPLAFSTLADLVHHVRSQLDVDQLARVVMLFSRNLQDSALPITVQTTSVRLLLNLVDYIFHNVDSNFVRGKSLLVCILRALVAKLETLRWLVIEFSQNGVQNPNPSRAGTNPISGLESLTKASSFAVKLREYSRHVTNRANNTELVDSMMPPVHSSVTHGYPLSFLECAADIRALLLTILRGLKTVLWCVSRYRQVTPSKSHDSEESTSGGGLFGTGLSVKLATCYFSREEAAIVSDFFEWGLSCCQLYIHSAKLKHVEEKEILDNLAGAFTVLDGYNLRLTVGQHIPLLFVATLKTPKILGVSQLLLANTNSSATFAELLLSYLIKRLDDLAYLDHPKFMYSVLRSQELVSSGRCGDGACLACASASSVSSVVIGCTKYFTANCRRISPSYRASILLRLMKIVFGSVTLFKGNENALLGRLQMLVLESLRRAASTHLSTGYLLLLRALFRSLGNSCSTDECDKFDRSHLEVEVILPVVVKAMLQLRCRLSKSQPAHFLITELCLTLPVRLSAMISTIPYLLEPLAYALKFPGFDLASLSLRTFEYYLEHLGIKQVSAILDLQPNIAADLLDALYSHLRPPPYPYATLAIRILGKLGGRNRHLLGACRTHEGIQESRPELALNEQLDRVFLRASLASKSFDWNTISEVPWFASAGGPVMCSHARMRTLALNCNWRHDQSISLKRSQFPPPSNPPSCTEHGVSNNEVETFVLPLDGCIDAVCELLQTLLRMSPANMNREVDSLGASLVSRYSAICFIFVTAALKCLVSRPHLILCNDGAKPKASTLSRSDVIAFVRANEQFQLLLGTVLCASAALSPSLQLQATRLLKSLCLHYAVLFSCLESTHANQCLKVETETNMYASQYTESLSVYTMNEMLTNAILNPNFEVRRSAVRTMRHLISCSLEFETQPSLPPRELPGKALISDLILRLCTLFDHSSLHARQGACQALHCLVPVLGSRWIRHIEMNVIKFLFRALNDHEVETSMQTVNDLVYTLCLIIRASHRRHDPSPISTAAVLVPELSSKYPAKRLAAQSALVELNLTSGLTELDSSLFPPHITSVVAMTALRVIRSKCSIKMMIGSLDALAFFLTARPPALPFDYTMQCTIVAALGCFRRETPDHQQNRDEASSSPHLFCRRKTSAAFCAWVSFSSLQLSFPNTSGQRHLLHAMLLHVIHAGLHASCRFQCNSIKHSRNLISIKDQLCYLRFALESITHGRSIIAFSAESLLHRLLATGLEFKHNVIKSHLGLVFKKISYFDGLSLAFLDGVERLLVTPATRMYFSGDLSETIFSHLSLLIQNIEIATTCNQQIEKFLPNASKLVLLLSHVQSISLAHAHANRGHFSTLQKIRSLGDEPPWADGASMRFRLHRGGIETVARLVGIVLKLEAIIPKYTQMVSNREIGKNFPLELDLRGFNFYSESSVTIPLTPFRRPLACFLSHHATAALAFFFQQDNLALPAPVSLLRAILPLPEAAALRCRLSSKEGLDLLSEIAFRDVIIIASRKKIGLNAPSFTTGEGTIKAIGTPAVLQVSKGRMLSGKDDVPGLGHESGSTQIGAPLRNNCRAGDVRSLRYRGLQILQTLQGVDPRLMGRRSRMLNCLRAMWRSRPQCTSTQGPSLPTAERNHDELTIQCDMEARLIVQCLVSYSRSNPSDIQVLFDVLTVLISPSPVDFTFLKKFLCDEVARTWTPENKRGLLFFFLRMLSDVSLASDIKVLALRFIVTPTLVSALSNANCMLGDEATGGASSGRGCDMFDNDLVALFMRSALDITDHSTHCHSEALRVELLKLTTVLIEHLGLQLVEHRKELIKFAWNHLKSDDSLSKQWAYVNVCRFIATYETPPKIILQVYVALLRTFQPEARELVKVALDVLVPSLPTRLPLADFIKAIKWTKKIMYEEGHALPQLIHMWQLIIRHPSLFYAYRTQFVPQMVNSLNRLGLPPNCPIENRQLAVSLADLVISWELQTPGSKKAIPSTEEMGSRIHHVPKHNESTPHCPIIDEFRLSTAMIELLINFLVRLALFSSDNKEPTVQQLATRCVSLFRVTLSAWPRVHIRFSYLEKLITTSYSRTDRSSSNVNSKPHTYRIGLTSEIMPYSVSLLSTCLDIFLATLEAGSHPNIFFIDNITKAQQLVFPCFDILHQGIQLKLRQLLVLVSTLYPASQAAANSSLCAFYLNLKLTIERFLQTTIAKWNLCIGAYDTKNFKDLGGTDRSHQDDNCCLALSPILDLLQAMCKQMPNFVTNYSNSLMQLAQHLATRHIVYNSKQQTNRNTDVVATPVIALLARGVVDIRRVGEQAIVHATRTDKEASTSVVVQALNVCINLIGGAVFSRMLSELRRPFVALLFGLIERSDSVALLSTILELVGKWICTTYSPLTQQERIAFSEIMSNVDRLDDVDAQPLLCHFLAILQRLDTSFSFKLRSPNHNVAVQEINTAHASSRPFAAGLLAPNAAVRFEFRTRFLRWSVGCIGTKLIGLLNCDWTPLSNRFWLVVIVEVLLDSINHESPKVTTETLTLPLLGCKGLDQKAPVYSSPCVGNPAQLLVSLKELTHAHLGLAQNIFQTLVSAASHLAIARFGKASVGLAISKQLIGTRHSISIRIPSSLPSGRSAFATTSRDNSGFVHEPADFFPQIHQLPSSRTSLRTSAKNIPHVLLRLTNSLEMSSFLGTDVLFMLASKYNCRHDIMIMIEEAYISHKINCFDAKSFLGSMRLLLSLLEQLAAHDLGLVTIPCLSDITLSQIASQLQCYGYLFEAQQAYFDVIKSSVHLLSSEESASKPNVNHPLAFALEFCENEWTRCARELSQWKVLSNMPFPPMSDLMWPSSSQRRSLACESAWKSQSWDFFKLDVDNKRKLLDDLGASSPQDKLQTIRVAVADRRFDEVEELCATCIEISLQAWCALPPPQPESHYPLLQLFHELIEVHESGQLLHEAVEHSRSRTFPDLRAMVYTWRNRLPNEWETMSSWDNIMRWREFCFAFVRGEFISWCSPERVLLLHDSPWTASVTVKMARKNRLAISTAFPESNEACALAIRMDVDDAFGKLREQILTCHASMVSNLVHAKRGLHLILNTSMDYFYFEQRAELHRLKGDFFCNLGQFNDAHVSFSAATVICSSYGRAWFAWAALCESQYARLVVMCDNARRHVSLLKYSIKCYLAAVEHGHQLACIGGIARVLCLVRFNQEYEDLASTLRDRLDELPSWIWVPWIYYLLSGLLEREKATVCACLIRVAVAYPQALYHVLHAEALYSKFVPGSLRTSLTLIESHMRCVHVSLSFEMDVLCDELVACFQPRQTEKHLSLINSCLSSCCDSMENLNKPMPATFCDKLRSASSMQLRDTCALHANYCSVFARDFNIAPGSVVTLRTIICRLVRWKIALKKEPRCYPFVLVPHMLVQIARQYSTSNVSCNLEVPGQYACLFTEPRPELHSSLTMFGPYTDANQNYSSVEKRIEFATAEGNRQTFLASASQRTQVRVHESATHFFAIVDHALSHSLTAQRRRLRIEPWLVFPAGPCLSLRNGPRSLVTLPDIENLRSSCLNIDADGPLLCTRQHLAHIKACQGGETNPSTAEDPSIAHLRAYYEVCSTLRGATDVMSRYICASADTAESFWAFRLSFAKKLGAQSLVRTLLGLGGIHADGVKVCSQTACVSTDKFRFSSQNVDMEIGLKAPFGLARNFIALIQPMVFDGAFTLAFGLTTLALELSAAEVGGVIHPHWCMFFQSKLLKPSSMPKDARKLANILLEYIKNLAPTVSASKPSGFEKSLRSLINSAKSPILSSGISPRWEPWL